MKFMHELRRRSTLTFRRSNTSKESHLSGSSDSSNRLPHVFEGASTPELSASKGSSLETTPPSSTSTSPPPSEFVTSVPEIVEPQTHELVRIVIWMALTNMNSRQVWITLDLKSVSNKDRPRSSTTWDMDNPYQTKSYCYKDISHRPKRLMALCTFTTSEGRYRRHHGRSLNPSSKLWYIYNAALISSLSSSYQLAHDTNTPRALWSDTIQ
jgi:hypothetical protein